MADRDNAETEDYHLVNLVVDGQRVQFATATITRSTTWQGEAGTRRRVSRWSGEIVSDTNQLGNDGSPLIHALLAETADSQVLEGSFTITGWHAKGFDVAGNGELTIT